MKKKKVIKASIGTTFLMYGYAIEDIKVGEVCYIDTKGIIRKARANEVKENNELVREVNKIK